MTDRVLDHNGELSEVKVRLESLDSEAVIPANENDLKVLSDTLDINLRIIQKTGSKITLKSSYSLLDNMQGNLGNILATVGFKANNFKVFYKDKLLEKNTDIDKIYEHGQDIYLVAFESLGKPKKWMRFPKIYEHGTWSNSGGCSDSIVYIPTKNIQVAGFVSYAAKDDPEYEMKYRLMINDVTKFETQPQKYSDWEDTNYKSIYFEEAFDAPAESKIQITVWIAKSFSDSSCSYTYYGNDGYSYSTVQNEQMGIFRVDSGNDSSNGTSQSSGQIPGILYYSD